MATEARTEHCKTYLEPSLKDRVINYQNQMAIESFSDALRQLIKHGLEAERQTSLKKIVKRSLRGSD